MKPEGPSDAIGAEKEGDAELATPSTDGEAPESSGGSAPSTGASSLRIYAALMSGRLFGFIRDSVVASFGFRGETDILNLGLRVSTSIQAMLGEQALSASLVPAYSRRLGEDRLTPESARLLAGATFARLLLVAGSLGLIGSFFAPQIADLLVIGKKEAEVDLGLVALTLRFLMPMAALLVLAGWCMAILNSHRRFFLSYFAPVFWNVAILAALMLLFRQAADPSMEDLVRYFSIGALVGGGLQLGLQLPFAIRINGGLPLTLRSGIDGLAEFTKNFTPVFFGRGSLHLLSIAEGLIALNFLAEGSLTALQFSQRLFFLSLLLCGMVQAFVYLPEFSRLDDPEAVRARMGEALSSVWFLTIPAALGLFLFSFPVVAAVFRWGNYGDGENVLGALILSVYAVGLVPTASSRVLQSALYAQNRATLAAWTSVGRSAISVMVAVVTMRWWDGRSVGELSWLPLDLDTSTLSLGALAFCTASAATSFAEWWFLRRRSGLVDPRAAWARGLRFVGLGMLSGLIALAIWFGLHRVLIDVNDLFRYRLLGGAIVAGFALCYLGLAGLFRLPEFDRMFVTALRRSRS